MGSAREHCKNCSSFHYRNGRLHGHYIARVSGQNRSRFRVVKYLGVVLSIGNTQLKVAKVMNTNLASERTTIWAEASVSQAKTI